MDSNSQNKKANTWRESINHTHVFVVLRYDINNNFTPESMANQISATKAFLTKEMAEAEVQRMNIVNSDKSCNYFWTVARLAKEKIGEEKNEI